MVNINQKLTYISSIYNLLIIFILFNSSISYIVLPFKIYTPKNYENITKLFNELLDNKLIITLQMGNPKKNMDFYASMNEYLYYLEEGSCNNDYPQSSSYICTESKTFIETKNKAFCGVKLDECHLGNDSLYLYQDINLKNQKEINVPFYYGNRKDNTNDNRKICGNLGFKIGNSPFRFYEYENFVTILKQKGIINSYSWYIHYFENKKNDFDGAIIFDIFNPTFFSDFPFLQKLDDYNTINVKDIEAVLSWTFEFDKVYYNSNDTQIDLQVVNAGFAFETDFIHCSQIYFDSIKKYFFDSLLTNKICFLIEDRYSYIYCEKQSFEKYKKDFPSLHFISFALNRTYVLNSDELFKDCGNYYFFMIIKPKYSFKVWTLGKIFMRKNNFYFDGYKKIIGYFDTVKEEEGKSPFISFLNKIKWYIFIIIGIVLGIFIGKKIREKTRKLRANELEDNYEYLENNVKGINSEHILDKNNNPINTQTISNYSEIKTQLYNYNDENKNS